MAKTPKPDKPARTPRAKGTRKISRGKPRGNVVLTLDGLTFAFDNAKSAAELWRAVATQAPAAAAEPLTYSPLISAEDLAALRKSREELSQQCSEQLQTLDTLNGFGRELGYAQGELDIDLAGCLRKAYLPATPIDSTTLALAARATRAKELLRDLKLPDMPEELVAGVEFLINAYKNTVNAAGAFKRDHETVVRAYSDLKAEHTKALDTLGKRAPGIPIGPVPGSK